MLYTIQWMEVKTLSSGKKLIDGTFKGLDGSEIDATIWRDNKDGTTFPNFDSLAPGGSVEANAWQNAQGKWIMFPPKVFSKSAAPRTGGRPATKTREEIVETSKEVQAIRSASITKTLDRKEDSFMISGTARDATLILTAFYSNDSVPLTAEEMRTTWLQWRRWLVEHHADPAREDYLPE